jgi:hypothetical protein
VDEGGRQTALALTMGSRGKDGGSGMGRMERLARGPDRGVAQW